MRKLLILVLIIIPMIQAESPVSCIICNNTNRDLKVTEILPELEISELSLDDIIKAKTSKFFKINPNFQITVEDSSRKFHQFRVNQGKPDIKITVYDGYFGKNKISAKGAHIITVNKG